MCIICPIFNLNFNTQIVWDSDKKKWVNTDGGAEEAEQFRPPPKMADMAPRLSGNASFSAPNAEPPSLNAVPTHTPYDPPTSTFGLTASSAIPPNIPSPGPVGSSLPTPVGDPSQSSALGKTPSLQSNMFKKQRNQSKYILFIILFIFPMFFYVLFTNTNVFFFLLCVCH